jgi:hypothetical protein
VTSSSKISLYAALTLTVLVTSANLGLAQSPSTPESQGSGSSATVKAGRGHKPSAAVPTGPAPRGSDGHPDLSGYWKDDGNANPHGNIGKDLPGYKLPFTPAGEAAHKYNVEHTIDPESLCLQGGLPREDAGDGGFQLLQVSGSTAFLYGYGTFRTVATDGRKHSEDPDPTYFGEGVGNWEVDTFVIDSVAFKDTKTWADENADPHSDALHTVERWTRPDAGHLHLELTIEDPKFYTQPIHFQRTWIASPNQQTREQACNENNIDVSGGHLGFGPGAIRADGTRGYDNPAPLPPLPSKEHPAVTSVLN